MIVMAVVNKLAVHFKKLVPEVIKAFITAFETDRQTKFISPELEILLNDCTGNPMVGKVVLTVLATAAKFKVKPKEESRSASFSIQSQL
jgi:hypothetical protein